MASRTPGCHGPGAAPSRDSDGCGRHVFGRPPRARLAGSRPPSHPHETATAGFPLRFLPVNSMESLDQDQQLLGTLQARFGLSAFRPGQLDAARAMLAGRDLVAVMPTGAGKSLCFQLPALLLDGATVVVSPLIALMKDQVDALRGRGIAAAALHSGLPLRRADRGRGGAGRRSALAPLRGPGATGQRVLSRLPRPGSRRRGWSWTRRTASANGAMISGPTTAASRRSARSLAYRPPPSPPPPPPTCAPTSPCSSGLQAPVELVTGFERQNLTLAVESCRGREDKARRARATPAGSRPARHRVRRDEKVGRSLGGRPGRRSAYERAAITRA